MTFCYTSGILLIVTNVRTLYILTANTVSVFPAKFIKYSLLLAYFFLLTNCWQLAADVIVYVLTKYFYFRS